MTDMLTELVGKLDLAPGDTLVSLGDLVDKGPDAIGTVKYLGDLSRNSAVDVVLVEANHEDKHLRYHRNLTERPGIAHQMAAASPELSALNRELAPEDRDFLNSAVLFWRECVHGILCVHGGIPGNMQHFPQTLCEAEDLAARERKFLRQVLRTRFVEKETGAFLSYGKERPGDPFWAGIYDGRFGHVVFGHQPFFDGPAEFPHATGIDTGAVDGGALTALVLHAAGHREYVSVKATAPGRVPRTANPPLR